VDDRARNLRFSLEEIERLLAMANKIGVPVEPWVEELARDLREERSNAAHDGAEVAGRMRKDPRRSLGAQGRLDASALRILKG
jgi:DNA-binding transcriptional MerR regulator